MGALNDMIVKAWRDMTRCPATTEQKVIAHLQAADRAASPCAAIPTEKDKKMKLTLTMRVKAIEASNRNISATVVAQGDALSAQNRAMAALEARMATIEALVGTDDADGAIVQPDASGAAVTGVNGAAADPSLGAHAELTGGVAT